MPHGAPKTTRAQRRLRRLRVVPAPLPAVRSVEETDPTSISEEELARRSNRRVREEPRGGLAARVGLAHRAFRKGFLTIPNQII